MVILSLGLKMEKEYLSGQMDKSTKGSGLMERRKVVGCGKAQQVRVTWDSGRMDQFRDLEFLLLKKEIGMKDNS